MTSLLFIMAPYYKVLPIEIIQYVYACKLKLVVYTVLFSPPKFKF